LPKNLVRKFQSIAKLITFIAAVSSNNTLTKPVIPSIAAQSKKIGIHSCVSCISFLGQSIAFEIPIDDLFDAKPVVERTSSGRLAQLPALSLSQQDIQAKLSNFEERWKVGAQLDHLLYGVRRLFFVFMILTRISLL
jgi:hypothetical protein